jgi:hypothetical protein
MLSILKEGRLGDAILLFEGCAQQEVGGHTLAASQFKTETQGLFPALGTQATHCRLEVYLF